MVITNVLLGVIVALLVILGVFMYVKINQLVYILGLNIMEPSKPNRPTTKEQHLTYNPADLFNPYKYAGEDLDPVVPDRSENKTKKSKNEY